MYYIFFGGAAEASRPFLRLLFFPEVVENIERDGSESQDGEKEKASGTGGEAESEKDSQNGVPHLLLFRQSGKRLEKFLKVNRHGIPF